MRCCRQAILVLVVLSLTTLAIFGNVNVFAETEKHFIKKIPGTYNYGAVFNNTLVLVGNESIMFIDANSLNIVKRVGVLVHSKAYVMLSPPERPVAVFYFSDVGEVLLMDIYGRVLYRTVIGFGSLVKAFYGYGYIHMMIDTSRGRELWSFYVPDKVWYYVSPTKVSITNAYQVAWAHVIDVIPSFTGLYLYVIARPILPPGYESYATLMIQVVNKTSLDPVSDAKVVVYFPKIRFGAMATTDDRGIARITIPAPIDEFEVYVEIKGKAVWFYSKYNVYVSPRTTVNVVVLIPTDMVSVPPEIKFLKLYVVKGSVVVKIVDSIPAENLLCATDRYVAMYSGDKLFIVDVVNNKTYSDALDSVPKQCAITYDQRYLAVVTKENTLYLYELGENFVTRLSTYAFEKVVAIAGGHGFVVVGTEKGVQMISVTTLKKVFRYDYPYLDIPVKFVYVGPGGRILVGSTSSCYLIPPIHADEPVNIKSLMPFSITLRVFDPWGNNVSDATVFVDGVKVCITKNGVCQIPSIGFGKHEILIIPPPNNRFVLPTRKTIFVTGSGTIDVVMNRNAYKLRIVLTDPKTRILRSAVRIEIPEANISKVVFEKRMFEVLLPRGVYTVRISSAQSPAFYRSVVFAVNLSHDVVKEVVLDVMKYNITVVCIAEDTGKPIPCSVCTEGICTNGTLHLALGKHKLVVTPLVVYRNTYLYKTVETEIVVTNNSVVKLKIPRAMAILNISLKDALTSGDLKEPVTVLINNQKIPNITRNVSIVVPVGKVVVSVYGSKIYSTYRKSFVVDHDMNLTLSLNRKMYSVQFVVKDMLNRPVVTSIELVCTDDPSSRFVSMTTPEGLATVSVPACVYRVRVGGGFYTIKELYVDPASDNVVNVILSLTPLGIIATNWQLIVTIGTVVVSLVMLVKVIKSKILAQLEKAQAPVEEREVPVEEYVEWEEIRRLRGGEGGQE